MRSFNLGCFGLLFALMTAPCLISLLASEASVLHGLAWDVYSLSYPQVMGTVTSSGGETVTYVYEVDGQTFQGDRYRYGPRSASESGSAEGLGTEFRVGSSVPVFYRHGMPWDSVLVRGVNGRGLLLLMGFAPFNLVLFGGVFLAVRALGKSGVRVRAFERNGRTHVRLSERTPTLVGLAALGAACLVVWLALLAVGGVRGADVPLPAVVLGWVLVVAAGVVTARWWRERLDRGLYDVILDQAGGVSLPPMHGRSERRDIPWKELGSVSLEQETRQGIHGIPEEYFRCMLHVRGSGAELVDEWRFNQDRAANLVNWLQARLGFSEARLVPRPPPPPPRKKKKVRY